MNRRHWLRCTGGAALVAGAQALHAPSAQAADLRELVARIKASVVAIGLRAPLQSPSFRFVATGFAIGSGNRIVTCAHALQMLDPVKRETMAAAVPGATQRVMDLTPVAINRAADLAVMQFDGAPLPVLEVDPADAPAGSEIVLMGFPLGTLLGLYAAAHRGLVAAITPSIIPARTSDDLGASRLHNMRAEPVQLLQLDATAYPGNSGSPVVDTTSGKVIGVVNASLLKGSREAALSMPTGISYAVPSRYLAALAGLN